MTKPSEYLLPHAEKVTPGATKAPGVDLEALAEAALRGDFRENAVAPIDVLSGYEVGGPVFEVLDAGVVVGFSLRARLPDLDSLWAVAAEEYKTAIGEKTLAEEGTPLSRKNVSW